MNYITTTELRTKSSELVNSLSKGDIVSLIHRSRIIGEIRPKIDDPKPFNVDAFLKTVKRLNLPKLSYKERERRYRKHMMEKYGKGVS